MEENHQETEVTTDTTNADKNNDASEAYSPEQTECEDCLNKAVHECPNDIHMSQPPSPSCSPQLTPREQTLPLPAISARQQMLRLSNPSNVCYANAGTNLLFSSPLVTRFLSALPDNNAGLNIVRQLATLVPYSVGNFKDLQKTVTDNNTSLDFNDPNIQEDTSEWIHALYATIWQLLGQNVVVQTNWYNLFNWNSTITFECFVDSDHNSEDITTNVILQLQLYHDDGRAITTLNDSVDKLFNYSTIIHKNCEDCSDNTRLKKNRNNYRNSRSISCTVYALPY